MSDLIRKMIEQARQALHYAYTPYSNYQVASCLSCDDDSLYTGVNIENASYGLTICAESSAICQMIAAGRKTISKIVIINGEGTLCSPCGACRQRIAEFSNVNTIVHLCNHQSILNSFTIDELLPQVFRLKP
jgi:cytidine deaminase